MKITQGQRIIDYMLEFGSISPKDAFLDLGITKLSTRVGELIRDGHHIVKTPSSGLNRWGEKTYFMTYSIVEEKET